MGLVNSDVIDKAAMKLIEPIGNLKVDLYMFEIDGICYAGKCEEGIKVVNVDVITGGMMLVKFITGEKRLFDPLKLEGENCMYIIDGIAYAKEEQEFIEVVDVKALDDMILILKFNTGEQRVFDATILNGEVFKPLRDKEIFNNVQIDCGVVTWMDGDIDCAPEYMYENSYEYSRV